MDYCVLSLSGPSHSHLILVQSIPRRKRSGFRPGSRSVQLCNKAIGRSDESALSHAEERYIGTHAYTEAARRDVYLSSQSLAALNSFPVLDTEICKSRQHQPGICAVRGKHWGVILCPLHPVIDQPASYGTYHDCGSLGTEHRRLISI